jgi:seryl-tRNA synthetase
VTYADRVEAYERKLNAYNEEVEKYNEQGGAPEEAYESLSERKKQLNKEQAELNNLASELNKLVAEINNIGDRGNNLINTYNQGVSVYNETFGESHEFTQGDYSNSTIKIYTFEDKQELKLVLVHELGHALSLGHVEGEGSMMHYLIGEQPRDAVLSEADLAEFNRVCGDISLIDRIKLSLER